MGDIKVDARAIKKQLREKASTKQKLSFYLDGKLYKKFKKACGGIPASQVVEALMNAFVDSSSKGGAR